MTTRKMILPNMNLGEILVEMGEGNPGGLTVMMDIIKDYGTGDGLLLILQLDDMNIRGGQIWVGYKDYAGQDLSTFVDAIRDFDKKVEMIGFINRECPDHKAIKYGASFPGKRP